MKASVALAAWVLGASVGVALLAAPLFAGAQPVRIPRVGVVYYAGLYEPVIDGLRVGLRVGLRESGLEEGGTSRWRSATRRASRGPSRRSRAASSERE